MLGKITNIKIHGRKAKIVCTLGPSSSTYEQIRALAEAGMDVARVNFSHGNHDQHQQLIETVRQVSEDLGRPLAVLQDLQGPKIRVQEFEHGEVELKEGACFTLTGRDIIGNEEIVSVSYKSFNNDLEVGDTVLLDDGQIKLKVEEIEETEVHCRVIYGGVLKNNKGVNLPGSILSVPCLTDKDHQDLEFGLKMSVDFIALSFVQKPDDLRYIKQLIADSGKDTPVVAKIEKPQAVSSINEITDLADVIMIARGDLGVEMPPEEVPEHQKEIISICNQKGVPVITATQMLDSMIHNPRPTRAEASDVANAVLDGSDALMLSGETAAGKYPLESVQTMDRIIHLIEKRMKPRWDLKRLEKDQTYPPAYAIGYSACHAADLIDAAAIVCLTQSGSTASMISRFRPAKPIIALSPRITTYYRLALLWGVYGFLTREFQDNTYKTITFLKGELLKIEGISKGDKFVITAGFPFSKRPPTNMLRIDEI